MQKSEKDNRPGRPRGLGRYVKFKKRECLRSQAWIPLEMILQINALAKKAVINASKIPMEYNINHPESDSACRFSNSWVPRGLPLTSPSYE